MRFLPAIVSIFAAMAFADAKLAPTLRLNNGHEMPVVGLGTLFTLGKDGEEAIKLAIDLGYRHIDSAYIYGNEVEVGNAIRAKIEEGVVKREDIFIVTKLWNTFHEPKWVEKAFSKSFNSLNLGYIDLFLMHWPEADQLILKNPNLDPDDVDSYEPYPKGEDGNILIADIDYLDTWRAMEKLVESGRVRSIGLSNFNATETQRIISNGSIKPVANQVECNPRKNEKDLINFSAGKNVTIIAHTPLGRPSSPDDNNSPVSNPKVVALAQQHQKSPAQIILRYLYQNGAVAVPKSTKKERLEENLDFFDFNLSPSEMEILDSLNEH